MARERLSGDYGKLAFASESAVTTGTLVAGVIYIPTVIGGSSALPTGAALGYPFIADGTEDITSSGDEVIRLTETDKCDITGWSIDFSKAELDATGMCDDQMVYVSGKTDASGSMDGIYTIGKTDADGWVANKFFTLVSQADEGGALTVNAIDDSSIVLVLYSQKSDASGESVVAYICPATILSFNASATINTMQTFSSGFRIAPNDNIKFSQLKVTYA